MRWTVTAMDIRMACVLPGAVGSVSEFCRQRGISRQTYYKWQKRFAEQGEAGLADLSRRPAACPHATPAEVEDAIVRIRKELAEDGQFNGPATIAGRLVQEGWIQQGWSVPSQATIARVLSRRGMVKPAPRKRPRSSYHRFQATRPNQMWQSDCTAWTLSRARPVAIAGTLDDHSRLVVGLQAGSSGNAELVWSVMVAAIGRCGIPSSSLSDNGAIYTNKHRPGHEPTAFEKNLRALGCTIIASTPYHPQTCGKIERLWQTLKKWLRAHGPYDTLADLNAALAEFAEQYNHRPHAALGGRSPAEVFTATAPARPSSRPLPPPASRRRIGDPHVSTGGTVGVGGYAIQLGHRYQGLQVTTIRDDLHVAVYAGNQLLRALDIDPHRHYQPLHTPPAPDRRATRRSGAGVKVEPRRGSRQATGTRTTLTPASTGTSLSAGSRRTTTSVSDVPRQKRQRSTET
jgi:transposase InsO family protein